MARILVTGGAGFIGSNFVYHLLREEPDASVVVLDKLTYAGNLENLQPLRDDPRLQFVRGDIADPDTVRDVIRGCDIVYNFAAESHVDRSIQDAHDVVWTNVRGTQVLLDAVRELAIPRYVQVSTDEVYGSRASGAFTESDALQPSNPYSACKAAGDLLVLAYVRTWKLPALVTRSSNNYGPYQHPEKLIPLHITNAMETKPLPIYGDGSNVRDWLHVEDNCRAIHLVGRQGVEGEIYNIAGHSERSNLWIVERIVELTRCDPRLKRFVQDRPGHDFRYAILDEKVRALGYQPRWSLEEGLKQTVSWYRAHEGWWQRIKGGEFADYYRGQYEGRDAEHSEPGGTE
ncbi:MAG: dTDP-glucose 4,6-dehydratase [Candidatus Latescibacterota bacterium]|nr:MAG: dTDP-glucose 4,6-dehydratase [Candidatus Latescibacterota bacterium]